MYALAVQVDPDVSPRNFWKTALDPGDIIKPQQNGGSYKFGIIPNPAKLIAEIQKGQKKQKEL